MSPLKTLPLLLLPLLASCVNDTASYQMENNDHAIILVREQPRFWEDRVNLAVIASRMPDCLRRHKMEPAGLEAKVELFQVGEGFVLRQGKRLYALETRTCEGFAQLDAEPAEGLGQPLGTFQPEDGGLRFVPVPAAGSEAAAEAR